MPHCVAYGCTPKVRAAAEASGKKISYHKFPEKNQWRKAWESRTRRSNLVLSKFSRLCSLHFSNESFVRDPDLKLDVNLKRELKPDAVPSIFVFKQPKRPARAAFKKRQRIQVCFFQFTFLYNI